MNLNEFQQLKETATQLRREADRAEGALTQLQSRLKEFGVATLEEAEILVKRLTKEEAKAEHAYRVALTKFEDDWQELGETNDG